MRLQLQAGHFYGHTLRRSCFGDLTLADVEYRPHSQVPRHSHERAYFCLIRRGTYFESYSRRARICEPRMLVFHPAGERHREVFGDEPVLSFNVELGTEWLGRLSELGGMFDQPMEFRGGKIAALCTGLFQAFGHGDRDSQLSIESLTSEILGVYAGVKPIAKNPKPDWLIQASEHLDASLGESPSLRSVASSVGIHPIYFAAVFRRFHGCSVGEYVRRGRIGYARQMLANPKMSLAEIAQRAGFADQSHFTRVYKRFTGKTPLQERTFLTFKTPPYRGS